MGKDFVQRRLHLILCIPFFYQKKTQKQVIYICLLHCNFLLVNYLHCTKINPQVYFFCYSMNPCNNILTCCVQSCMAERIKKVVSDEKDICFSLHKICGQMKLSWFMWCLVEVVLLPFLLHVMNE